MSSGGEGQAMGDSFYEQRRTSFGALATVYDEVRPSWPADTAAWLTGSSGSTGPSRRVLDLGAGTGKLTRTLVEAGHDVVAVDTSEGMLAALSAALPDVEALVGSAEDLPLPDGSVDVVTVAQAWHWFDPSAAAQECARVLRPGGLLSMAWHLRWAREDWVLGLDEILGVNGDTHPAAPADGGEAGDPPDLGSGAPSYGPAEDATFTYDQRLTPDGLARLASSWSYVALHEDREQVLEQVRALGASVAGPDGTLVLPHLTRCYRFIRSGAAGS